VIVEYYLRIAYDHHDTTFLQRSADDTTSVATADEHAAQAAPFTFTVETPDVRSQWGPVFPLPNVGIHNHVLPNGHVLMWGRRDSPDQSLEVDPPSPIHLGQPPAPPARHGHSRLTDHTKDPPDRSNHAHVLQAVPAS
jgi:hypothetical protein